MAIQMVALQAFTYGGKRLRAGDEFSAHGGRDARVLIAIRKADFAPAVAAGQAPWADVATPADVVAAGEVQEPPAADEAPAAVAGDDEPAKQEMRWTLGTTPGGAEIYDSGWLSAGGADDGGAAADEGQDVEISPRTGRPKRQYKRRDLTAED